jgi:hypothetical protein
VKVETVSRVAASVVAYRYSSGEQTKRVEHERTQGGKEEVRKRVTHNSSGSSLGLTLQNLQIKHRDTKSTCRVGFTMAGSYMHHSRS